MKRALSSAGLLLALLPALPAAEEGSAPPAESRELYGQAGADLARWEPTLAALRAAEPQLEYRVVEVPARADSPASAKACAKAVEAGVAALPSLALRDAQGIYATLPLSGLTPQQLEAAKAQANDAERESAASRRRFNARCYLLCARISQPGMSDDALSTAIEECRLLLQHARAENAERQFLGLRCLYPLLMTQYARGYNGAHSPQTEAKLLEAIAALEAARDLDRESPLGKEAHAERERLRMARREARKYE